MTVFRVYDDEWEQVMGTMQIRKFAFEQTTCFLDCNSDEEVEDEIEGAITLGKREIARKFIKGVQDGTITSKNYAKHLNEDDAIEVLKLRYFDVEELNVY